MLLLPGARKTIQPFSTKYNNHAGEIDMGVCFIPRVSLSRLVFLLLVKAAVVIPEMAVYHLVLKGAVVCCVSL